MPGFFNSRYWPVCSGFKLQELAGNLETPFLFGRANHLDGSIQDGYNNVVLNCFHLESGPHFDRMVRLETDTGPIKVNQLPDRVIFAAFPGKPNIHIARDPVKSSSFFALFAHCNLISSRSTLGLVHPFVFGTRSIGTHRLILFCRN